MNDSNKAAWQAPKLDTLEVNRTLTGPAIFDAEATFQGRDQGVGGPAES